MLAVEMLLSGEFLSVEGYFPKENFAGKPFPGKWIFTGL
jgi:hypothetical protein